MSDPETAGRDCSLDLTQVLEEEYVRVHGSLPYDRDEIGCPEERLNKLFGHIHGQGRERGRAALCLSGGGIRSGTFALGVLQGLARHGLLKHLTYLSTVSGGGYAGGWLSAWIHRHEEGLDGVTKELKHGLQSKLDVEPETIRHLRSYSNYLSPRLGMLSADTWTLVALVVRNLVLNWLVIVPLLLAVLAAPRLLMAAVRWSPTGWVRTGVLILSLLVALWSGIMAIIYVGIKRPSANLKEKDNSNHFLFWCLLPLLISATSLVLYWAWLRDEPNRDTLQNQLSINLFGLELPYVVPFIIFGVLLYVLGWLVYSIWLRHFRLWEFVSILLTGAVGGLLLWLVATKMYPYPRAQGAIFYNVAGSMTYVSFAAPIYLGLFFLAITLFAGISSKWTEDEDREWWARFGAWLLIAIVGWCVVSALVLMGPSLLDYAWENYVVVATGGLFGVITTLLGRSSLSPGTQEKEKKTGLSAFLTRFIVPVGSIIFAAVLGILLSLLTNYLLVLFSNLFGSLLPPLSQSLTLPPWAYVNDSLDVTRVALYSPVPLVFITAAVLAGLGLWMAHYVSTNKFSHHAMYRNRIIRAYLGASRGGDEDHGHRDIREPNLFTGFDPDDNLPMHELRPELFHPASFKDNNENGVSVNGIRRLLDGLKEPPDKLSKYLKKELLKLPTETTARTSLCEQLDKYDPKEMLMKDRLLGQKGKKALPPKLLRRAFINAANALLRRGHSIYDEKAFAGVELSEKTQALVKSPPDGDALVLLNRRLLEEAYPSEIERCPEPPQMPFHVVNMTLNLVRGEKLAWQERKAESFTVSPLHCGSWQIPDPEETESKRRGSYRRSDEYGGKAMGGISVGTAVAVSGAAVSPNMGYFSSPVVTFLMTLLNVRLGWWLGNPARNYYQFAHPNSAVYPIVAEALGLTDDKNDYIYLSDGGHFENLGLYEMVLRRCDPIIVCDATGDPKFEFNDLGNAIRKCRVDLGIPIEFDQMPIYPRSEGRLGKYCAVGRINYGCVDEGARDGVLIYLKPAFYGNVKGNEPRDVYHYALSHENFPHESTGDQFFGEAQFESYRMLGSHIVDQILGVYEDAKPDDLKDEGAGLDNLILKAHEHSGQRLGWLKHLLENRGEKSAPRK